MKTRFFETGEINGSSFVRIPLRSPALTNKKIEDQYCFVWSVLAYLHPAENDHPNRVSNYRHYFNEFYIAGFDFSIGFKCSDVHKIEKLNNLSITIFELFIYRDKNNWKHKTNPIEISKNESDKVIDL